MTKGKINKLLAKHASTLKLIAIIVLAFIAALTFRRSAGILAMTPISLLMCAIAAFIGVGIATKCTVFAITAFAVNTIENDDMSVTLTFSALCLLAILVLSIAAKLIKKGKKHGYIICVAGVLICIGFNLFYVGNPFTASKAKKAILEYADTKYHNSSVETFGNFEFSSIYYRYDTKAYNIDAVSDKFPTEIGTLSINNEVVSDGFKDVLEERISEQYVLEIKDILRKEFPNDSFGVNFDGFALLPDENVFSISTDELYDNIRYEIVLGGIQTSEQMKERVVNYVRALDASEIGYANLVFKSGIGNWQRRYVSIDPHHMNGKINVEIKHVGKYTSNRFNDYLCKYFS